MKKKTERGKTCLLEKEAIREKKMTWNAKRKLRRLERVMTCLDLAGRETQGYVRDERRVYSGCRKQT